MRLLDYLRGRRLTMVTPLPAREVERRISAAAVSMARPGAAGVSGWARVGRLQLWVRESGWSVSASPVLAGRIASELVGSRLYLWLRPPLWAYYSLGAWYATAASTYTTLVGAGGWSLDRLGGELAAATLLFAAALLIPLRFNPGGEVFADPDAAEMIEFLELEAKAKRAG